MSKLQTVTRKAVSLLVTALMICTVLVGTPLSDETAVQAAGLETVSAESSAAGGYLAPAFTATEISGTYYLKNKGTGTYLYALGTASKSGVALAAKKTTTAYQMKIAPVAAGNASKGCYITPASGSVVLNPFSDTPTNGTTVNLYTKNTDGTQYWIFEAVSGGYILHNSYNNNLVLNGTTSGITVATNTKANAQIWVLESTAVTLSSISIATKPNKLTYNAGETLNTAGMTLKLTYSDGSTKTVSSGFKATADLSTAGSKTVTVSYTASGVTKTATFKVTVNAVLTGITLTQLPDQTAYSAGDTLNTTGMKVTASYTGADDKDVTASVNTSYDFSQAGTKAVMVSYTENSVTKTATFNVTVGAVLSGLKVTQAPGKTVYSAGETLDTTGMKITATYSGAADKDVTDAVTVTSDLSTAGTKAVTVSYTEDGVTKTATFTVMVNAILNGIKITQQPSKTAYSAGETLDTTGMKVTASYTGAADKDVTASVTASADLSTAGTKTVTVSYTENGVTKTATFKVTVDAVLTGIKLTQSPSKTAYSAGETLDTTGMKVTASYTGAADKDVTASVTVSADLSTAGTKTATVSYTENGVTKTATFNVTVTAVLSGIKVAQSPNKTVYSAGETLDTTGMKVTASYTGAADKDVTASVTAAADLSTAGSKTVTVSYTENGVTKTATFKVTVNAVLTGIKVTQLPDKTDYYIGDELDTTGMKVTASYRGAADADVTASVAAQYDLSELGDTAVTLTYEGFTAEFTVTVHKTPDPYFAGEGTEESPFLITGKADLEAMRDLVNDPETTEVYGQAYYRQTADIDLGGESWLPIGKRMRDNVDFGYGFFNGSYDGDYHKIVGLNVVSTSKYSGLFGSAGGNAVLKNLHVEGSVTSNDKCTGGIIGEINNTVISNCSFVGNIKVTDMIAGGLVGNIWQGGTLVNCYHIGTVTNGGTIGGLAGYVCTGEESYAGDIIVENCYHVGEVGGWSRIGSAFGYVQLGTAYPYTLKVSNVCTRTGDASAVTNGDTFNGSVTALTESALQQAAESLGDAYLNDPETLNSGYPMLLWELKAIAGLSITAQPHNQTNVLGYTAKFSVTAKGDGLTYQWQMNSGSGWKNSGGDGATTNTLSIPITTGRNGNLYRCVITHPYGFSVISDEVMLKVKTSISAQPQSITAAIGEQAKFTVSAKGVGLTYQWQYNKGAGWVNSNGTGSKTNTLSINVAAGYNGYQYRCIINNANNQPVTSAAATLTVETSVTGQPQSVTAAIGEQAKFTVSAKGVGLTYQWQYNKGAGWVTSNGTGSKTVTLTINTAAGYNGYQYRCIITDANGASVTSEAASLTVKTAITTQPADVTEVIGTAAKFTVTAVGAGLTYQWQYNKGAGWVTSNGTGSKTATLTINTAAGYNAYQYRCIVTDANGTALTSEAATLKVRTAITTQPNGINATVGSTAKFTVAATGAGLRYQWQYNSGDGWKNSNGTGAATAALSISAKTAYNGWRYRCIITDANGAATTTSVATLKIKAAITAQPADITAATGTTAKFTVTATGVELTYQWQYNSGDGWKNSNGTGAATAALSINAKATYNGWQYRCIVTDANGNKVTSSAAALTVS